MRMVGFDRDFACSRQLCETIGVRAEWKSDELDRAYLIGRHLAFIEARADAALVKNQPKMALEAYQAGKLDIALGGLGILDQQGREEFARPRDEFVVGLDLGVDRCVLEDALGAQDFLDLIPDRLPILEHQREMLPDGEAAACFLGDAQRAQQPAYAIVGRHGQHFEGTYGLHGFTSSAPAGSGGGTGSAKPSAS
jgi:hypothetical protein